MFNIRNYGPKKITLTEVKNGTREVVEKEHNVMPLSEASLNRIMDHADKDGIVIISSQVSSIEREDPELDLTAEFEKSMEKKGGIQSVDSDALYDEKQEWLRRRNAFADKQLRKDIHDVGFSYTPVFGGYKMKETGEESFEPSYIVYPYTRKGELVKFDYLRQFALDMCRKYKQESVYVQGPGDPPVYLDKDGNQINTSSSNNFKFNRDNETYFTTASRDKNSKQRFTGDIVFESMYIPVRPGDYNERMRRQTLGEFIL